MNQVIRQIQQVNLLYCLKLGDIDTIVVAIVIWIIAQPTDPGWADCPLGYPRASTLQCGADKMKFQAMGPGASQFQLDQGTVLM